MSENQGAPADFRSDTVTRPSARMRRAIAEADVADDVLDGDPTVRLLEETAARYLGKEGALFVPSGTQANQIAIGVWTRPGDEIILEERAHILSYESGALGALHGVQTRTLNGPDGALDPATVEAAIRPDFVHCPRTSLLCVEQTHMGSGGRVVPLERLEALAELARSKEIPVHMDGARLANAAVAAGVPAAKFAATANSVSLCLSKGLGAPVGSVIAGDEAFLERARVLRKRFGGWMRQSGLLAAAALMALEEGPARLAADHSLARDLGSRLAALDGLEVDLDGVETNLVPVRVTHPGFDAPSLSAALAEQGVLVLPLEPRVLRFVTHHDVDESGVERMVAAMSEILS